MATSQPLATVADNAAASDTEILTAAELADLKNDIGQQIADKLAEAEEQTAACQAAARSAVVALYDAGMMLAKQREDRKAEGTYVKFLRANGIHPDKAALAIKFYERAEASGRWEELKEMRPLHVKRALGLTRAQRDAEAEARGTSRKAAPEATPATTSEPAPATDAAPAAEAQPAGEPVAAKAGEQQPQENRSIGSTTERRREPQDRQPVIDPIGLLKEAERLITSAISMLRKHARSLSIDATEANLLVAAIGDLAADLPDAMKKALEGSAAGSALRAAKAAKGHARGKKRQQLALAR